MEQGSRKVRIAVFASGSGTNAENLIKYFTGHAKVEVSLVVCNNPQAGVLERAKRLGVKAVLIDRAQWKDGHTVGDLLKDEEIGFIVLAGFLWLVPAYLIHMYPHRIVNIHPALLPNYGGKGMYGSHVHEAVKAAGDAETGITIHYVNQVYDEGEVIAQYRCHIDHETENAADIAQKVHALEYEYYPRVVERLVSAL